MRDEPQAASLSVSIKWVWLLAKSLLNSALHRVTGKPVFPSGLFVLFISPVHVYLNIGLPSVIKRSLCFLFTSISCQGNGKSNLSVIRRKFTAEGAGDGGPVTYLTFCP